MRHPIAVMGLPLDSVTSGEAVKAIESLILSGGSHQVATANLDFWLNSISNPHLHRILAGCSLVVPDGMPLVWASKLLGSPLVERVTGVDLVPRLAELSARKGYGIYLLGGQEGVADRAARLLEQRYPGARIVGTYAPFHGELAQMDHSEIIQRIHAARPDILMVAFGNPKQEKWIWMHRKRLGVPVSIGVGASFDILVGDQKRAPRWIQRCGMEWLTRLAQEPGRLGPRYMRDFAALMQRLPLALLAGWSQRAHRGPSAVTTAHDSRVMHVYLHGKLTLETAPALERAVNTAVANGLVMVAHLKTVREIDAEGMGCLMSARRQLFDAGLSLSVASLSFGQRFLFHAWCALPLFDEWESPRAQAALRESDAIPYLKLKVDKDAIPAQLRIRG
jgi:N-acetylglucosaminyldiphosphoundecaprenol N-acetyl-beta-D-mannosaminyltransferase